MIDLRILRYWVRHSKTNRLPIQALPDVT